MDRSSNTYLVHVTAIRGIKSTRESSCKYGTKSWEEPFGWIESGDSHGAEPFQPQLDEGLGGQDDVIVVLLVRPELPLAVPLDGESIVIWHHPTFLLDKRWQWDRLELVIGAVDVDLDRSVTRPRSSLICVEDVIRTHGFSFQCNIKI